MRDTEKLQEIEALGGAEEEQEELEELGEYEIYTGEGGSNWSGAPLLQAVVCALAVLVLVFFKLTGDEKYSQFAGWYRQEMAREIELPEFGKFLPAASPSPEPEPTASPTPTQQPNNEPPQIL